MKKLLLSAILVISGICRVCAEEGMWLPMLLGKQVYQEMLKKGLKLTSEQLYSMNKASLKDAIVIFGGGCTGEMVSAEGLLFTNHHCGYDAIAAASSVENNYLLNGFYARNRNEEIPTTLSVQFLLRVEDVTREVMDSLQGLSGIDRMKKQSSVLAFINRRMSDADENIETRVSPIFKGNQYLAFVYQRYTDVRLVGTPPENVGNFGGNTDNWEWPRHTGDFAIFRVYSNAAGKPAKYATSNKPLQPKWFLPVSLQGVREGDFTMVWGYPGSTNRYESSFGIRLATDINNPTMVKLRSVRLKYMLAEMKKDPAVRLKLATAYAVVANYWKFYDGETRQLLKQDVYAQKKKAEDKFNSWAAGKPEYRSLFTDWAAAYDAWRKYAVHRMYINEGIFGSPLMAFAASLKQVETALVKTGGNKGDLQKALDAADKNRSSFLKEEDSISDRQAVADITRLFYTDVPKDQQPIGFYGTLKDHYGPLNDEKSYQHYASDVFSRTFIFDDAKWKSFIKSPDANLLQSDPAFMHASAFYDNYNSKYSPYFQQFMARNGDYGRIYIKGLMEMDSVRAKKMYPDGTFTMRFTYGEVKSYRPRDAVLYEYATTSKGLLQKYIPGDYEFDLPSRFLELIRKKDFGPYIDKQKNDLVLGFISTNDITGGNSGSPVLNGRGELIGLSFDGNYEALGHKLSFDKDIVRCINVDIRYVLWCIDKLGGASYLIKELKIVK